MTASQVDGSAPEGGGNRYSVEAGAALAPSAAYQRNLPVRGLRAGTLDMTMFYAMYTTSGWAALYYGACREEAGWQCDWAAASGVCTAAPTPTPPQLTRSLFVPKADRIGQ